MFGMQRGKTKLDEDLGPDREDDFQTDDEENRAERVFEHLDDDSESDNSPPSPALSNDVAYTPPWPQSYRQSMDMLKGIGCIGRSNSSTTEFKRARENQDDSSLALPLITNTISLKQDEHPSIPILQPRLSCCHKFSATELPPPHEQCSFAQSVINGTNILCGIGILSIPYAIKKGGWLSLSILVMFATVCCYTGILMKRCLESHRGLKTYPDIGQAAFGLIGRLGIAASCVEYIILVSDNLSSLFPDTHLTLGGADFGTQQVFAITAAIVVLPTVWLRNLSLLSYISVGGIFATTLVALCLFWVGVVDHVDGYKPGGKILDIENISVSIGLYSFGFAGHAVFPNVYSAMKEPSKFPYVIYICFGFCLLMYLSVGAVGYLTFGDKVSSQFTLNMPKELYASDIATWTTVVTPLAKYALTLLPIALSIEELAPSPRLRCHATSIIVRTILVILSLLVALFIPYFGSLMALIGSMMSMLVALIFPCACYLKLHSGRLSNVQLTNCVLIIIVGLIGASAGTYSAIVRLAGEGD
ncbi:hypothetical protein RJT34_15801 [Clitoria ternatea]|uniref:Amino acid transporter transmembrane domain-containing protein n=1 Tax=Clitoria ternatea TaxID=43366 RepID=A0AAN9J6A6_CLITE